MRRGQMRKLPSDGRKIGSSDNEICEEGGEREAGGGGHYGESAFDYRWLSTVDGTRAVTSETSEELAGLNGGNIEFREKGLETRRFPLHVGNLFAR